MKKIISACLFLLLSNHALSQPAQKDVISLFPTLGDNSKKTISFTSLTDAQKNFLSQDTTQDLSGFLKVQVTAEYLAELVNLNQLGVFKLNSTGQENKVGEFTLLGSRSESKFRDEFLFEDKSGIIALASRWNFKNDGGSIVVIEEYLNFTLIDLRGTFSHLTSPQSIATAWKFSGSDEETLYDITLLDPLSKDESLQAVKEVEKKLSVLLRFLSKESTK